MGVGQAAGEGLRAYYKGKIEELEIQIRDKQHNLRRMEAQRNELNNRGACCVGCAASHAPMRPSVTLLAVPCSAHAA